MDEQGKEANEQAPMNPDLAGYPSVDALVQGYRASGAEAKKWRERAEELERAVMVERAVEANPRRDIPQRGRRPQDRLTEFGVPVDAIEELLEERIQKAFAPIAKAANARQQLQAEYPDYVKFESDVAQFIESDPRVKETYNDMFTVNPAGAFEYAFLKFSNSRRKTATETARAQDDSIHASIPGSQSAGGSDRGGEESYSQALQRALKRYQETGSAADAKTYAQMRLHRVISEDHLSQ